MKPGEPFRCPACGEDSIVKMRRKMDGFRCVGEELVCMLCGAALPPEKKAKPAETPARPNALADLLGVEETAPERLADDGVRKFCRDCRYCIIHPFLSRCDLFDRAADPMGDCPRFVPKEDPGKRGKDA